MELNAAERRTVHSLLKQIVRRGYDLTEPQSALLHRLDTAALTTEADREAREQHAAERDAKIAALPEMRCSRIRVHPDHPWGLQQNGGEFAYRCPGVPA